jgi:hypothetical protein
MAKQIIKRQNQYRDNINPTERVNQVKTDESLRAVKIGLYDVDAAIKWHLENVINVQINTNQGAKKVPVIFATPEKWSGVQAQGFLRDNNDKIMAPVIVINRTGFEQRQDYVKNDVLKNEGNQWVFERKYSQKNKYTPFDILTNTTPIREFYALDIPRFIHVSYDIICWTEFLEQMNDLTEQIMFFNGTAFGDTQKFPTIISAPSFELSNEIGNDRFVKAKFSFTTKAYLINEDARNRPSIQKLTPPTKITVNFYESSNLLDSANSSTGNSTAVAMGQGSGGTAAPKVAAVNQLIYTYLNTAITKQANIVTVPNSVTFSSSSILQPPALSGLPATTVNDFRFFINGQYVPISAVTLTVSGADIIATFDTGVLGYELELGEEVIGIGKWA